MDGADDNVKVDHKSRSSGLYDADRDIFTSLKFKMTTKKLL